MEKRKFSFSANLLETGYVCVSRSLLRALCLSGVDLEAARVMAYIQSNVFFKPGIVSLGRVSFLCQTDEWITSCREIGTCLGLHRCRVRKILDEFERLGWVIIRKSGNYLRLTLTHHEGSRPTESRDTPAPFTLSGDTDPYLNRNIYSGGQR